MTRIRHAGLARLIMVAALTSLGLPQSASAGPAGGAPRKGDQATCDRAAFRVVVDVGHTAEVPGAKSARGNYEYDFNFRLATLIDQGLHAAGFEKAVLLVTSGPARKSLTQRVAQANTSAADLFLSIHHDSVPDRFLQTWEYEGHERSYSDRFKGHSIFISSDNPDPSGSLLFGQLLGQQMKARGLQYTPHYTSKIMGLRQRILVDADAGVYRYDQLIVLKDTEMPAVLLEAGSIINRDEELVMSTPERQSLISTAAVNAVEHFCGLRAPRNPSTVARRASAAPAAAGARAPASPKPSGQPAATTQSTGSTKPR